MQILNEILDHLIPSEPNSVELFNSSNIIQLGKLIFFHSVKTVAKQETEFCYLASLALGSPFWDVK